LGVRISQRQILCRSYTRSPVRCSNIPSNLSVAAKKGTSLAVEREPVVGLRSGLLWAQK
jgi:hypothetical protein